jgi:hypothetical protein
MADKKFVVVQVTFTEDYFIPMINDDMTEINGWSLTEVIKDWFLNLDHPMLSYHATRDGHHIGNSKKYISSKITDKYPKK